MLTSEVVVSVSGTLTYSDISEIVEALVYTKGYNVIIPGLGRDDIAQEIRAECFRALRSFNAKRIGPSPYKYLERCVHNYLYNMRRGIYVPNNPPCVRCPFWDKVGKTCTIDEADPDDRNVPCKKITDYRKSMSTKASIKHPSCLSVELIDPRSVRDVDSIDLHESIRTVLSKGLFRSYERMIGGKDIPYSEKKKIRDLITEMLNDAESN
jgi:hypothetical protein